MAENYTIDATDGVITVRFSSEAGLHDIRSAIDDVAGREPNNLRLWDMSLSGLKLSDTQLSELAEYAKSKSFPPSSKVAIVASSDLAFGLSRVFEVYREDERSKHRVFRTVREAWDWLNDSAGR